MPTSAISLTFSDTERQLGGALLKFAEETDRIEGYTEAHAAFIARLAEMLGAQCGLHGSDLTAVKLAALAHDLGERVMKRGYLLHPGALAWEEQLDLWRHPILGEQAAAQRGLSRQAQLLIRWHHEWWNGGGYPDALTGEAIPLGARIIRLVDTFGALVADRPYRPALDEEAARRIIADQAGIEFDPRVVQAFLALPLILEKPRYEAFEKPYYETPVDQFQVPLPASLDEFQAPPQPPQPSQMDELQALPTQIEPPQTESAPIEPPPIESPPMEPRLPETELHAPDSELQAPNSEL